MKRTPVRRTAQRIVQRTLLATGLLAVLATLSCGGRAARRARNAEHLLRSEIAQAEARREASVGALTAMLSGEPSLRAALAARALGRIGGPAASAALLAELAAPDRGAGAARSSKDCSSPGCPPSRLAAAAAALGVAAALQDPAPEELTAVSTALERALGRASTPRDRAVVIEALGRAGTAQAQAALAAELVGTGPVAEAAALALGRHGRRRLPWSAQTRAMVVAATARGDAALRLAATWALSRESLPGVAAPAPAEEAAALAALVARLGDGEPEVRAAAAAALARRKLAGRAVPALLRALGDADWRVAVEAARAVGGAGDPAGLDGLAEAAAARLPGLGRAPAGVQVLTEALRQLAGHGGRPAVAAALEQILAAAPQVQAVSPVGAAWTRCLARAALLRAQPTPALDALVGCGASELPLAYSASVVVDAVASGAGTAEARRTVIERLLQDQDVRVRAAALPALPVLAAASDDAGAALEVERVIAAVGSPEAMLAGAAIELAGQLVLVVPDVTLDAEPGGAGGAGGATSGRPAGTDGQPDGETGEPPWRDLPQARAALKRLTAAMVARAGQERDPELAGTLLAFIAERKLASGLSACQSAARDRSPVTAGAAARCVAALTSEGSASSRPEPFAGREPAVAPPIELALGIPAGQRWTWIITTNHGEVEIALDGTVAPWHVATVVALTRRGFYDGLDFHRVVPNFVVQGGDPTESGSGGPGFTLPAEPGSLLDGDSYRMGAVGFADAGKDSGGSQWFVMHSRAPHLEGRYTRVGQVRRGQDVVARLLVGDRVISASVRAE